MRAVCVYQEGVVVAMLFYFLNNFIFSNIKKIIFAFERTNDVPVFFK